jgi:hypothetical protein
MFPSDIPNLEPKKQGENGWQPIRESRGHGCRSGFAGPERVRVVKRVMREQCHVLGKIVILLGKTMILLGKMMILLWDNDDLSMGRR